VNPNVAAWSIIVGASLLAVWVAVRLPQLTPGSFKGAGLHMVASIFVVQIGMRVLGDAPPDQTAAVLVRLFGIALPATIYLLLSAFWVLKLLHGLMDGRYGKTR
jgi:hypothetical protein